jgi:hypothetical protein
MRGSPPSLTRRRVLRRRQRQIDIDVEAIRGLAVIEGWSQTSSP